MASGSVRAFRTEEEKKRSLAQPVLRFNNAAEMAAKRALLMKEPDVSEEIICD